MARPIQLSKSNYFALLMPDVVSRNHPVSHPPLSLELIEKMYGPVQDLSLKVGKYQMRQRDDLEMQKILWDQDTRALDNYLMNDQEELSPSRYTQFLEAIVKIAVSLNGEGFENQLSTLKEQHFDFAIKYYRDKIYWIDAEEFTTSGILLAKRADQSVKDQIWLLANAYHEYVQAGRGKRNEVCREIESRDKFKKAILVNIRQEFIRYDDYFMELADRIDDYRFAFTSNQKTALISFCAEYML